MDIKEESVAYKLLCNACLCVGRKLHNITNEKMQKYYLNALDEIPLCNLTAVSLQVCWECKALLEKSIAFREQVQDSYRILQTYTQENLHECLLSDVSRPPRLKVHCAEPTSISPSDGYEALPTYPEVPIICVKDELKDDWECDNDDTNILEDDTGPLSDSSETTKHYESELQSIMCSMNRDEKRERDSKTKSKRDKKIKRVKEDEKIKKTDEMYKYTDEWQRKRELANARMRRYRQKKRRNKQYLDSMVQNDPVTDEMRKKQIGEEKAQQKRECAKERSRRYREKKRIHALSSDDHLIHDSQVPGPSNADPPFLYRLPKPTKEQNQKILTIELTYEEMLLERDKESAKDAYTRAEYKCESCLIGFTYRKSYSAHVAAKHSAELGDYICPICKTIIPSVESFTAHYKRHMRRYECGICHKRTLDIKVMQQHYYSTHEISLKEYKCNLCGKISNSIDTHRYHKDTHKARVQCTECDKTFRHRAGLKNHRLAVHEYRNTFPCTICDKVFRWKTSLKRHLEKHEVQGKSSSAAAYCSMCNVSFSSIFSYQRHMKNSLKHVSQDQLKFICDHCDKRFADKTKLRDHIEEKHLHKTYQCQICLKPSKNRVGLDQHTRNVHKGRPNNKMCHHCGKGFPTTVQLESHIRSHTGERPFTCEYCPTTFSQQSNLYKHIRQVHLNIKSKRYPMCKKREEKLPDVPTLDHDQPIDPYRPVPMLHYTGEKVFGM